MSCEHNFGIIENLDTKKDYGSFDEFNDSPDVFQCALRAYNCVNIDDDALNNWWPRIENMAVYWNDYSHPEKGLARCGVTLIPPESLDLFYSIVKDHTRPEFAEQAAALLAVIDKARRNEKFVIHFGV